MGESHTTKKRRRTKPRKLAEQATTQATVETVAELMAYFVEKWSRQQLLQLAQANHFVCLDLAQDFYRVGKFNLRKQNGNIWAVSNLDNRLIHNFQNKQAAVFYCLYESRHLYHKAMEFLQNDQELARIQLQVNEYLVQLHLAQKRKDSFKQDLYLARLSNATPMLELLETNLQKTINGAKYSKVWETNHETARTRY